MKPSHYPADREAGRRDALYICGRNILASSAMKATTWIAAKLVATDQLLELVTSIDVSARRGREKHIRFAAPSAVRWRAAIL